MASALPVERVRYVSDCTQATCGYWDTTYSATDPEPPDTATGDPADCDASALPGTAVIVDDMPVGSSAAGAPCSSVPTEGSFAFRFTSDSSGNYPAHIDLHQINGGLNGHYWFTHTDRAQDQLSFTGTWNFPTSTVGWGRVYVHVPSLGAQTRQAPYTIIDGATGAEQARVLNQSWGSNHWLSLGDINFTANEKIQLANYSAHDNGADIAFDAVAWVPVIRPVYKVVAMGDSYSAGEGLQPYFPNADNPADACHRSSQAYANLIKMPGTTVPLANDPNDDFDFIACSGAQTTAITPNAVSGPGQEVPTGKNHWGSVMYDYGELPQATQGYLDSSTTAVTLSIGGNDVRFSQVVATCYESTSDCSGGGYVMQGDSQPLNQYETHIISDLLPSHLVAAYSAIHSAAPNASIFVVGYPHLFPSSLANETCPPDLFLLPSEMDWMNRMSDLLATSIQSAIATESAQGVKIYYVDPRSAFNGHDVCAGSSAWINAIVLRSHSGSGTHVPGTGSFHPKASGQAAYGRLVTAAIAAHLP